MKSTRGQSHVSIDEAIVQGLASDFGLFIPDEFPHFKMSSFADVPNLATYALRVLTPFFAGSRVKLNSEFCHQIFSFPLHLVPLNTNRYVAELFHGPTLSFKDFGARFFAQCLQQLASQNTIKVLVATSGDTGSAVASAFHGMPGVEAYILFPKDKISDRQQIQITCWGDNIHAIAVNGTFDQCQQLVKRALSTSDHPQQFTTANSINIARLLPQILFYVYASIRVMKQHGQAVNFIVPSGNLGNVTACYWAKQMGFPIDDILIANNANQVLVDFMATGTYQAQSSIETIANAMDVGDPSNLERLLALFSDFNHFKKQLNVASVSDAAIKAAIVDCYQKYQYILCPHSATAYHRLQDVSPNKPWVIMATAHPAKFNEIIEPLLKVAIPIPEQLQRLLSKKQQLILIEPHFDHFKTIINH